MINGREQTRLEHLQVRDGGDKGYVDESITELYKSLLPEVLESDVEACRNKGEMRMCRCEPPYIHVSCSPSKEGRP